MIGIVNTQLGSRLAIGDRARLTIHRYLNDDVGDAALAVPWRPARLPVLPLDLLSWRSRYVPLVGRETDQAALLEWARTGGGCQARVLTGPAGSGKSRLAAEVASILQQEGWTTGVAGWNDSVVWRTSGAGALAIVDDPPPALGVDWSELPPLVEAATKPAQPVRLLILSRASREVASAPGWSVQQVAPLSADAASALHEAVVEHYFPAGVARPARAFGEWREGNPESATLPLYAIATALHVCHPPWDGQYAADGRTAIVGIVNATWRSLNLEGQRIGLAPDVLPLITALASACGELDEDDIRRLGAATSLTMAEPHGLVDRVERLPLWRDRRLAPCWTGVARGEFLRQTFADAERKGLGIRVAAARPITSLLRLVELDRDLDDAGADARVCRFLSRALPVHDLGLELQDAGRPLRPGSLLGRLALRAAERGSPAIPVALSGGLDGHAEALAGLARHLAREEGADAAIAPAREAVRLYRHLLARAEHYRPDYDDAVALLQACVDQR